MRRFKFLKIILMVLIFFSLVSAVVMTLWNWLMPELFDLTEIDIWQAAGILLLSKILFGGFKKNHYGPDGPPWKKHWQKKWQNMPQDKREKWKQHFASKWCTPQESTEENTSTIEEEKLKDGH